MFSLRRASLCVAGTVTLLAASACSMPTINGFTMTAGPSAVTLTPGGSAYVSIAATTKTTSAITAAVIFYNLPVGVTITPASPTVTTGGQTSVTITAAPSAPAATAQTQITAYAGLASSTQLVSVTVAPNP